MNPFKWKNTVRELSRPGVQMKLVLAFIFVCVGSYALAEPSVVGKWKTIDDKTGQPKSVIEISQAGEGLQGKIIELINPKEKDPVCKKCEGERKDKPVLGMQILSGFTSKKAGQEWVDGDVLDPENGKTYRCILRLKEEGKELEVRGYIGISLFGRSQRWKREEASAPVPGPTSTPTPTPTPMPTP
jgi:uncharacterized protein (DUF2147 family)